MFRHKFSLCLILLNLLFWNIPTEFRDICDTAFQNKACGATNYQPAVESLSDKYEYHQNYDLNSKIEPFAICIIFNYLDLLA